MCCCTWLQKCDRDLVMIPVTDVSIGFNLTGIKSFYNTFTFVFIPVSNQDRISICRFNQIFKSIQLSAVDNYFIAVIIINASYILLYLSLSSETSIISNIRFLIYAPIYMYLLIFSIKVTSAGSHSTSPRCCLVSHFAFSCSFNTRSPLNISHQKQSIER